ncbi:MAG TPA: oligosaccharide flippase family protein [Candidatus Barnesiella excrementigallinarum]|nr:oligosaccharide flippase family protein [Candidatus Barnesiella excrementigallinarum]
MNEGEEKNLYRTIVKATGLFGGTQVFTILCSIIKTKLVAVWLGEVGVGIIGLYNNTVEMISSLTKLGIGTSSVRDLSRAFKSGDLSRFSELVTVVRRWIWFTGLLGAVVMLTFAPVLSRYTFGDDTHIWGYVFLSCTLLFTSLTEGERAVIQASERLRVLARCSVLGSFLALLLSLPLFYFFGISGIVPAIIVHTFAIWIVTVLLGRRMKIKPVPMSWGETYRQGKHIASLGIYMTVSGFVTTLYSYLFVAWLNHRGGTGEVGFFQAGYTLVMQYVGLVFTAMSMEYYPRLSAVCEDRQLLSKHVSQQIETSLLILAPFISLFIVMQTVIIHILYTADFLVIGGYISWAALGMLLRAFSWSVSFVLLAKGAGRLYLITEVLADTLMFVLYLVGYTQWGLTGVGVAYLLAYLFSGVGIYLLCRIKFGLRVSSRVFVLLVLGVMGCAAVLLLWHSDYVIGAWVVTAAWVLLSGVQLKRRLSQPGG